MAAEFENLKIVVIDCPMKYLDNPFVRDVFSKIAQLKVEGFKTVESKYFAFGLQDLIATHVMAGEMDANGQFTPLIGYKGVSKKQCEHWGIPFDGLDVVEKTKSISHILAIKQLMNKLEKNGKKIGYQSSLALSPRVKDRLKCMELVKMIQCLGARYILDYDVDVSLCIARVKEGSPRLLKRFGYEAIRLNENVLPTAKFPQYINDEFKIMVLDKVSDEGRALINKYRKQWEERIEISEYERNLSHIGSFERPRERRIAS